MKRVLLLFTFIALVLAGVASADRDAGSCCPAGEAGKRQMQGHGEAHHAAGTCCGPKAGAQAQGRTCCSDSAAARAQGEHAGGCCEKKARNGEHKAGCCEKHEGGEHKAGCCDTN